MTGSLLCCALFGWIICVTVVRCELSTVQKCNKQQLQHQTLAVTSRQPYMRLTFRSLQRSVTLPASQTLQHNLCQTWKSPVRSRLLSGLWCVLLFLEHRNFPWNEPPGRETRSATRGWLTDRHWNTEAESHFSREWNWGKERCGNTVYRATATPFGQRWTHVC